MAPVSWAGAVDFAFSLRDGQVLPGASLVTGVHVAHRWIIGVLLELLKDTVPALVPTPSFRGLRLLEQVRVLLAFVFLELGVTGLECFHLLSSEVGKAY